MFPLCKSRHAAMTVVTVACSFSPAAFAQAPDPSCPPPLCVSRTDDHAARAVPGMLRYAVDHADDGAVITFHPALRGQKILLDGATPGNHIRISRHLTVQGPGADLLTISGGGKTRIFFIAGVTVHLHGLTLSDGFARGGDGAPGAGAGGGGGGAAGMGGAIMIEAANVVLDGVVLKNNHAVGGDGGYGGTSFATGDGGSGGGFGGPGSSGSVRGPGGDLATVSKPDEGLGGPGGNGGSTAALAAGGGEGGWGAGGGGGAFLVVQGGGSGGAGGSSGFAGGFGGAGGFFDQGIAVPGRGGSGGAGLGGAIFVSSGFLYLLDTRFEGNACRGGNGAPGAVNGQAKGGALFVCSRAFCGASHDAAAVFSGTTSFAGNTAEDAGLDPKCPGRDDSDLCGHLSDPVPARFSIAAPPSVNAGEEFSILVTAIDRNDRIVPAFNGEVHLTITDGAVSIPLEATLTRGLTWLTVSLSQAGRQTITALSAAEPSIRGSAALRVQPATPDH